jgi:hypothetical protein
MLNICIFDLIEQMMRVAIINNDLFLMLTKKV